ncbi:unnamed protein product [Parnassius apollo]|uniref:(apollo) hypothetical protein n=1 Tax=Parnassius apollo TaxID=110799 RepID=A0A8S3XL53_PARAO|nr:unnamed protein product [Parnassius apollo]
MKEGSVSQMKVEINVEIKLLTGRIREKDLRNKYAVAGTLNNKGYKPMSDDTPEGQWRKLKEVLYPAKYKFPKKDICIVV